MGKKGDIVQESCRLALRAPSRSDGIDKMQSSHGDFQMALSKSDSTRTSATSSYGTCGYSAFSNAHVTRPSICSSNLLTFRSNSASSSTSSPDNPTSSSSPSSSPAFSPRPRPNNRSTASSPNVRHSRIPASPNSHSALAAASGTAHSSGHPDRTYAAASVCHTSWRRVSERAEPGARRRKRWSARRARTAESRDAVSRDGLWIKSSAAVSARGWRPFWFRRTWSLSTSGLSEALRPRASKRWSATPASISCVPKAL
mmetsp:Transcript_22835/g.56730  ORF Transcript_22835/g.56730 Transcript_22835/m.56730 type:complete len:257 (-) Transcript_22835:283-1053(-)